MLVTIVCAWCNAFLGDSEWPDDVSGPSVTHSICPDCLRKELAKVGPKP